MKKSITTAAFLLLGTMLISAQTTMKKDNSTKMPNKPATSTEMKMETTTKPNAMSGSADTTTMNKRSRMQSNPNQMRQNQSFQNSNTLKSPSSTMPNNSTTTPQVQPVSPVDPGKPAQ
ncbi:MAG: hypothetical protein L6262_10315 [Weeksellaceae bacterium]|nr:hypothetical protein [Weeksellaceae bacterium]